MPYITRDATGKIIRASAGAVSIPGAEALPHGHPELVAFLTEHGQDPTQVETTLAELRRTDNEMARAVEDIIVVLLKKNILKLTDLPKAVQDRMALRVKLRMTVQDIYNQASGNRTN